MADVANVRENVKKMIDGGATEQEIDEYISLEGVTVDDLQEKDVVSDVAGVASGLAKSAAKQVVAGAAIGGAIKGLQKFNEPARQIKAREKTIGVIKENYLNEPFISSQDVPSRIKTKGELQVKELSGKVSQKKGEIAQIKTSIDQSKASLKNAISLFDEDILASSVEDAATMLKNKVPEVTQKTYANYGLVLDNAENKLTKLGKNLSSDAFVADVLNKTINDSISVGVPEDKLGKLVKFRNAVLSGDTSEITDVNGKPFKLGQPVSVRQLKGNVRYLSEDIPQEAAMKLKGNWGSMLESSSPEVAADISSANKDYVKFSKFRNAMYKTVDAASGDFDKTKLNRMLYAYAKSNVETGLQDTINLMAKGQGIVPAVGGVEAPFSRLVSNVETRKKIIRGQQQTQSALESNIYKAEGDVRKLNLDIDKSKQKTALWISRAEKLLSEQEGIAERHPIRSGGIGRAIKSAAGVGTRAVTAQAARGVLRGIAIYPMISGAVSAFTDPLKAIADQIGYDVPEKGSKERAVLEKFMATKEEQEKLKKNYGEKTPEELGVTPEEENEILYKYGLAAK